MQTLTSEADILARLQPSLTVQGAHDLLGLNFSSVDQDRMFQLLEKASRGERTADEDREAEDFERVGHLLSMLKSIARQRINASKDI
jgi:hypothetical protein